MDRVNYYLNIGLTFTTTIDDLLFLIEFNRYHSLNGLVGISIGEKSGKISNHNLSL